MTRITEAEQRGLVAAAVREVRAANPLAPSITNTVTQNFVANAQLAVGGSAAMVYLPDEGECVAALGGAVYLNGRDMAPMPEREVARRLSVLMTGHIHPELMTCRDVAATGRYPYTGKLGLLTAADWEKVDEALALVHGEDLAETS